MQVTRGYHALGLRPRSPAVTIGNFDGVHVGHQAVMQAAVIAARARGGDTIVCTFDPHTAIVLRPHAAPPMLQTLAQRLAAIAALGVEHCVVIPFDMEVAATGHEHFVDEFLRRELAVQSLHVSKGFSFGRDRAGSTAYLERRARECGFTVQRVPPVLVDGDPVSSSRVRDLVQAGEVARATRLLGRPFALAGMVVPGAGRGRVLGVPTANLAVANGCLPGRGVYVTVARICGVAYRAVTNVGVRPTFGAGDATVVETHVLEATGEWTGEEVEVAFLQRLRDERRFADATALTAQLRIDIENARVVHRQFAIPVDR